VSIFGNTLFLVCAAIALLSAFMTVVASSPIRAAFALLANIVALAGLFLTLHAHLLAVLQLVVYAGAVVVLFVFVIMFIGPLPAPGGEVSASFTKTFSTAAALLVTAAAALVLGRQREGWIGLPGCRPGAGAECQQFGGVGALARSLFGENLVPFELIGVLLTVAVVGAIMVARGPSRSASPSPAKSAESPESDLGE
jgi:NADH-quinone oxidoreductase subunit J